MRPTRPNKPGDKKSHESEQMRPIGPSKLGDKDHQHKIARTTISRSAKPRRATRNPNGKRTQTHQPKQPTDGSAHRHQTEAETPPRHPSGKTATTNTPKNLRKDTTPTATMEQEVQKPHNRARPHANSHRTTTFFLAKQFDVTSVTKILQISEVNQNQSKTNVQQDNTNQCPLGHHNQMSTRTKQSNVHWDCTTQCPPGHR